MPPMAEESASKSGPAGPREWRVPEGDDRERLVCPDCGHIAYRNPRLVVGAVAADSRGRVLLCRRAIPPRQGYWTVPAGYLELGEGPEQGARREAAEEARAEIALDQLLAVYSLTHIDQVQLIYRARLMGGHAAGPESKATALFAPGAIPWDELAFPTVGWALTEWLERRGQSAFPPGGNRGETGPIEGEARGR